MERVVGPKSQRQITDKNVDSLDMSEQSCDVMGDAAEGGRPEPSEKDGQQES